MPHTPLPTEKLLAVENLMRLTIVRPGRRTQEHQNEIEAAIDDYEQRFNSNPRYLQLNHLVIDEIIQTSTPSVQASPSHCSRITTPIRSPAQVPGTPMTPLQVPGTPITPALVLGYYNHSNKSTKYSYNSNN